MARVVLQLDPQREQRLRAAAARTRRSEAEVCRDALDSYLAREADGDEPASEDAYAPLLQLIGLVKEGPPDGSVHDDVRPGDPL